MATINLLPWREELRVRRQKEFIMVIAIAVILMGGVVAGVHWVISEEIAFQKKRNQYLLNQIALVDRKIKAIKNVEKEKNSLLERMRIIEQLQSSRPEIVHLIDELVGTLPEGVYYTQIKQADRGLDVRGVAQSNARVSSFMRNIDKSAWIERPNLVEIRRYKAPAGNNASRFAEFSLRFEQRKPKREGEGDGASS